MVEIGDKVFIAPLYGQKDNIAVITGPAGAGAVLNEGNYNTWTHEWTNSFPDGLYNKNYQDHYIDDKNNILYLAWLDSAGTGERFALLKLSDFSTVFLSPSGSSYLQGYPYTASKNFVFGAGLCDLSLPHSIQSYVLLARPDWITIEVWRGGVTYLWSHDVQTEVPGDYPHTYSISTTGKYIIIVTYDKEIILYKGSYVEP